MISIKLPKQAAADFLKEKGYVAEAMQTEAQYADFIRVDITPIRTRSELREKSETLYELRRLVYANTGMSEGAFDKRDQRERVVDAKKIFCYLAWRYTNESLKCIGMFLNNMHHTSVVHLRDCGYNFADPVFVKKRNEIEQQLTMPIKRAK